MKKNIFFAENLCIHGYNLTVKDKALKRPSTIVKHSRYLHNMVVSPVYPAPPKVAANPTGEPEAD